MTKTIWLFFYWDTVYRGNDKDINISHKIVQLLADICKDDRCYFYCGHDQESCKQIWQSHAIQI